MSPAAESWTVRRMLAWMAEDFRAVAQQSARLDAELLLARVLGCDRVRLYMDLDRPLDQDELARLRELVRRRRSHEPVAYILGEKEFYRRMLEVDSNVLVPRPETELVVDRALERIGQDSGGPVLDLCTGSGAIAIALAAEREQLQVDGVDVSAGALELARRNVERHGVADRVALHHGDLFEPLAQGRRYALIVSNPPYVTEAEWVALAPGVRDHEPRLALVGGRDGLEVIRRIVAEAPRWLAAGGGVLLEVGAGQSGAAGELLRSHGFVSVCVHPDLSGIGRVVEASVDTAA